MALYCLTFPTRKMILHLWKCGSVPPPLQTWFQTALEFCHREPLAYYTGQMPDKLAEMWLVFIDFQFESYAIQMWLDLTGMLFLIFFYWSLIVSLFHCHLSIWLTLVHHGEDALLSLALSSYTTALWICFCSSKKERALDLLQKLQFFPELRAQDRHAVLQMGPEEVRVVRDKQHPLPAILLTLITICLA